jgi:murein DD-endopeptidase MepM/ murein hydrolase activator NlpD
VADRRELEVYPLRVRVIFYCVLLVIVGGAFFVVWGLPDQTLRGGRALEAEAGNLEAGRASDAAGVLARVGSDLAPGEEEFQGVVEKRETVSEILLRHGFAPAVVHEVNRVSRPVFDLRLVRAGQPYTVAKTGTELRRFTYEIDPERYLRVENAAGGLWAEVKEYPFAVRVDSLVGTISSSLYETVQDLGEGPGIAIALSEVFAWDIDFFLDIREGDQFKVFFERKCLGDSVVCLGRVLAAEFSVQGKSHSAFRFADGSGWDDFYDGQGKSLRKALLRAPLSYTRISSGFSHRRFHPIRRRYMPHLGVDYAAPTGTPVLATGDGSVTFAARKGASGNMVQIRHNETYTTYYLHLSRFGRGIRSGARVKQGQVIGYVGSTGVSTGAHLDYRVKVRDRFVDPRSVALPAAQPVAAESRKAFEELRDGWIARLGRLKGHEREDLAFEDLTGPTGETHFSR